MIYLDQVMRLSRSITFKSIWTAFSMNLPLKERGLSVPDIKSEWRYFKHLNGELHHTDEVIFIDSLDTNELIELNKTTLLNHKKTHTFYRDRVNREKLHEKFEEYTLYIDGIFEPIAPEVAIAAEDGDILLYDKSLVESQEYALISSLGKWIKESHYLYFMESWAGFYPLYTSDFMGKIYSQMPGKILQLRADKVHTSETHSFHINEFLASHQGLNKYSPYLTLSQKIFLYRNIRYIERHTGKQDTFEFLIEHLLTRRNIPIDAYDITELYTDLQQGGLYKKPIGIRQPINFKERVRGRDLDLVEIDEIITKEAPLGTEHERMLDEYRVEVQSIPDRSRVGRAPTKLLEVTGVDPDSFNSEKLIFRIINEWAYHSANGTMRNNADIIDPQSGNSFRVTPLQSFSLFLYAYYKGYHGIELSNIPTFNVSGIEDGVWYTKAEYLKGLRSPYTENLDAHIDFFANTTLGDNDIVYNRNEFYDRVINRIGTRTSRERYLGSQLNDRDRAEVEWLYDYTYRDHTLTHALVDENYTKFLYELGIDPSQYSETIWRDLCSDLLRLTVDYDPDNLIGFDDIQGNLIELFSKLSSYTIQFSSQYSTSDRLITEPTLPLVQHVSVESESHLSLLTEGGIGKIEIETETNLTVDGFDMLEVTAFNPTINHIKIDTAMGADSLIEEEIFTRVVYSAGAIATDVSDTNQVARTLDERVRIKNLGSFELNLS